MKKVIININPDSFHANVRSRASTRKWRLTQLRVCAQELRSLKLKFFEGQTRNHIVTRGPHCAHQRVALWRWRNNGGTWNLLETAFTSYFLRKV